MAGQDKALLMRSVNEGIAFFATDLEPAEPGISDRWSFVCECGRRDCSAWVDLDLAAYAQLRAQPEEAVLAPGHAVLADAATEREPAGAPF
jgi:hypothetical protein